jgi:hypothetical protein
MSRAGEARTAGFFSADNFLLGEGSLYERLRRDPAVTFDRQLAHGGLLYDDAAADVLEAVHRAYLDIGQSHRIPMIASTATWKANGERIASSSFPQTSALWKRIHFDHHQDSNDLGVLFGALYTTLPTKYFITAPIGWVIGGASAAAAAFSAALVTTCFYEFCHCIQHLPFKPRYEWLRLIKKRHLAHHFHSEKGNYGITNFLWDRMLGTYYESPKRVARSETVFNLGYCGSVVERYLWVAGLSGLSLEEAAAGSLRPRKAS